MKRLAIALAVVMSLSPANAQDQSQTLAALIVNGTPVSSAEVITTAGDAILFTAQRWGELGITVPSGTPDTSLISSKTLGLGVVFHADTLVYEITVPAALRPLQRFDGARPLDTNLSDSPMGVMVGYDLSLYTVQGKVKASLSHDLRANVAGGTLYHSGQYNPSAKKAYARGLTTWSKDIPSKGLRVQVGDVFTSSRSGALNNVVNLGGVRVGTDRDLSSETMYPVPVIAGVADTRSTAELLVNEGRTAQRFLEPGPYQFANMFYAGGLNDITTIVRDDTGREHITTRSAYVMPKMVRKGSLEWDVALGKVRQGSTGDRYTSSAAVAQFAYGVTNNWTVSGGVQSTGEKRNLSLGNTVTMGRAGALSLDLAKSNNGNAYSIAYERKHRGLSFRASHSAYSEDYWQLSDEKGRSIFQPKSLTSAGIGYAKGKIRGDLSYTQAKSWSGSDRQQISGRLQFDASNANSFNVYMNHDLKARETTAMLGWQHALGPSTTSQLSVQVAPDISAFGSVQGNTRIGNVPVQWLASTDGKRHYASATADFSKATVSASVSSDEARASVEGGLWIGEGGVVATKRSYSSFVVAEVPGTPGVVIQGPGSQVTTNKNGFAVIPNTPGLLAQPLRIDSESLSVEKELESMNADAVAPRGGGAKVVFPIKTETMRTYQVHLNGQLLTETGSVKGPENAVLGSSGYMVLMKPEQGQSFVVTSGSVTCTVVLPELAKSALITTRLDCKEGL